jgi:hypothetical protein
MSKNVCSVQRESFSSPSYIHIQRRSDFQSDYQMVSKTTPDLPEHKLAGRSRSSYCSSCKALDHIACMPNSVVVVFGRFSRCCNYHSHNTGFLSLCVLLRRAWCWLKSA